MARKTRILVTGGTGFLGSHLVAKLKEKRLGEVTSIGSRECDLTERDDVTALLKYVEPTIVIHCAATVGGIEANSVQPATYFYANALMGLNILHESHRAGVKRLINIGTVCEYPKSPPVPYKEADLWSGYPEETNAPYGLAKKMLLVQGDAYRRQYGFDSIHLLLSNLYGPGDNFDERTSHFIPAMIRKLSEAKKYELSQVDVWGSGRAVRDFLYVKDAAEAIIASMKNYYEPVPLNIGSGVGNSISSIAHKLKVLMRYNGTLVFDTDKLEGQIERVLDVSRAFDHLHWRAGTSIDEGLKETVAWYESRSRDNVGN